MEVDVNSVVLAARLYASLRESFFIGNRSGDHAEADGGAVITTIRETIVGYVEELRHENILRKQSSSQA